MNGYMFRRAALYDKESHVVYKSANFNAPVKRKRDGSCAIQSGFVYACMTSDFFIEEADDWRKTLLL